MHHAFAFKRILSAALLAAPLLASAAGGQWDSTLPSGTTTLAEWNVINSYPSDTTPDVAGAGTLTWTATLLGVALLVLAAGYFAPLPPAVTNRDDGHKISP